MLSRFVIFLLPWRNHLLISWLQSPSTVTLEPKKIKSATVSTFSPSICLLPSLCLFSTGRWMGSGGWRTQHCGGRDGRGFRSTHSGSSTESSPPGLHGDVLCCPVSRHPAWQWTTGKLMTGKFKICALPTQSGPLTGPSLLPHTPLRLTTPSEPPG